MIHDPFRRLGVDVLDDVSEHERSEESGALAWIEGYIACFSNESVAITDHVPLWRR